MCHLNARILLANLLQSARSTFSCEGFLSFFAFKEDMLNTPISALRGWPTVSARFSCIPHAYWSTSSASRSRDGGIVIPSAWAVLRLRIRRAIDRKIVRQRNARPWTGSPTAPTQPQQNVSEAARRACYASPSRTVCCSRHRAACSDSFMRLAMASTAESSAAH